MQDFKAFRVTSEDGRTQGRIVTTAASELSAGNVLIRTAYSSINYKDALAVTGRGKILRRLPLIPGIDAAGTVESSKDKRFAAGDQVLVTGCGLGEEHDGGYSEYVRVPADWVVPLPPGLSLREAMALGTAGFTAGLALARLEGNGTHAAQGPVLVTGASGGVGSFAVDILSRAGYSVTALTGKPDQVDYLKALGADEVLRTEELDLGRRPLERSRWGAAIDNVGGELLSGVLRTMQPWSNVAAIGLAGGHELNTTVMPFILRGVSLIGINSVACPYDLRLSIWQRLAAELKPRNLERIVQREVALEELEQTCEDLLDRKLSGRTLVRLNKHAD